VRYKTIVEVVTDGDNEDEALDKAGEYLRGNYNADLPLRVRTLSLKRGALLLLAYTIVICLITSGISYTWFSAGRSYQKIVSKKRNNVETYAVHPPLNTDVKQQSGKNFKKIWDKLYKERILHKPDKGVVSN